MFTHVINAKHIQGYKIWLAFNDGLEGEADLTDKVQQKHDIFKPLLDLNYFKDFVIKNDTLSWKNGADLAPEFLYDLVQQNLKK